MVDSESDADDERLPVGGVPEDVIAALESDLCPESSVIVGDAEVFAMTDDAASIHGHLSDSKFVTPRDFFWCAGARVHPRC